MKIKKELEEIEEKDRLRKFISSSTFSGGGGVNNRQSSLYAETRAAPCDSAAKERASFLEILKKQGRSIELQSKSLEFQSKTIFKLATDDSLPPEQLSLLISQYYSNFSRINQNIFNHSQLIGTVHQQYQPQQPPNQAYQQQQQRPQQPHHQQSYPYRQPHQQHSYPHQLSPLAYASRPQPTSPTNYILTNPNLQQHRLLQTQQVTRIQLESNVIRVRGAQETTYVRNPFDSPPRPRTR